MIVRLVAKSGLDEEFFLISFFQRLLRHGIVAFGAIAQLEFLDDVVAKTAVAEVGHTDATAVYVVAQDILEIIAGKLIDNEETFAFALNQFFFVGQFPFLDFDTVFFGKVFQGFGIGHLLVLHDEVYDIAAFSAGEALAQSFGRRYVERRCFVVMERA